MSPDSCRKAVIALARETGWGHSELCELDIDELMAWLKAAR